jgi:hypothetical protein
MNTVRNTARLLMLLLLPFFSCAWFVADYTTGIDMKICETHLAIMRKKLCRIEYGMPVRQIEPQDTAAIAEYLTSFRSNFMNAKLTRVVVAGGEIKSQKWSRIFYCEQCNAAYRQWEESHKQVVSIAARYGFTLGR